ncbi:Hemocyanin G chain [Gossypium arboreum]|uniref:Hemocyanin G chain n=1 Tax=Gossypium arboreum TaxID=29729 RepID=A0A0B0MSE2_GOSAR|nr:Hemocyanin G chain [Gossypium arboreum]KHG24324.1 Hemocyanin G chain [Gossypium arboreum]
MSKIAKTIYVMFCASVKEICDLCLKQVTKWRDAIKDALHIKFKLSAGKEKQAKICEQSKVFIDAVQEFNGKTISSGLFQSLEAWLSSV